MNIDSDVRKLSFQENESKDNPQRQGQNGGK